MYNGELVRLRALEIEDLDTILEPWNNLDLRRHLATQLPVSKEAERQWLERGMLANPFRAMMMGLKTAKNNFRG